ncbi:MAG: 16S rRNA (cytosine(1402)-N(4))-methyltransferase RsmH [Bryobacteraceae bacterium]|nr:16S rRNA (cytosine(1402)-N(4))-methyltransferase RsmH [Bryobacteraceae bacterium]
MHYPVLLAETLEHLAIRADGLYADATAGLGGHTGAIAGRLTGGGVIAADRDAESLERARESTAEYSDRIRFVHTRFSGLAAALASMGVEQLDGLVADLGVSRMQLTTPERGFSFMAAGPVDMRMDRGEEGTAQDLVDFASERELADLLFQLGDERRSRRIARAIVRARPIRDTLHLADVVEKAVPRTGALHPATQTFMALRIAVNQEREELEALLRDIPSIVKSGGRVVFLTFMSAEDRVVKQAFQALARERRAVLINKHVITPSEREVRENPPSRSAKLRALEMR